MRQEVQIVGTVCAAFSVDPDEFTGMTLPQVTAALLKTAGEIQRGANFFVTDAVEAANQVLHGETAQHECPCCSEP